MRKRYLDALRTICIFLLFPFHTLMMYNNWGEGQYVSGTPANIPSNIIHLTWPWIMSLMFLIAGISTRYALAKRTPLQYVKERVMRLFLPAFSSIVLLTPFLAYMADVTNNGYNSTYLKHYIIFFTRVTDLTGYDGGFTPAHLWFLLYLFIISLVALPIILFFRKKLDKKKPQKKPSLLFLACLGFVPAISSGLINIGGKSLSQFFFTFLIGYFILARKEALERLEKHKFLLLALAVISGGGYLIAANQTNGLLIDVFYFSYSWLAVIAALGLANRYLCADSRALSYFSDISFLVYIFHYPCLVAVAYFFMPKVNHLLLQIAIIVIVSSVLTLALVEIIKRIPVVQTLFGYKKSNTYKNAVLLP